MSRYLFQASYTSESWAAQVASQANIVERVTPLVTACHGSVESVYYAFGDYDAILLLDFPTSEDAAAFSLAVSAGGSVRAAKTTPLLTVDEGIAAMRAAAAAGKMYAPPVGTPVS